MTAGGGGVNAATAAVAAAAAALPSLLYRLSPSSPEWAAPVDAVVFPLPAAAPMPFLKSALAQRGAHHLPSPGPPTHVLQLTPGRFFLQVH